MGKIKWLLIVLAVIALIYALGPNPSTPQFDTNLPKLPSDLRQLDDYVRSMESAHKIKPDNEARIIWASDSGKQKTKYSIVYLHGFGASQGEGEPVHRNVAKKFGANLYLSRLAEHGLDTVDQFINLSPEKYWESAKQAYEIGKQLGDEVIVVATSTGGTLALQLAASYPEMKGLVLLSPNIEINDENAWLLNNPWGLQIARAVVGSNYIESQDQRPLYKKYWYSRYRIEGAVALEEILENTMTEQTFQAVKQPTLMLYYYKDEIHQDSVVKVSAMKKMFSRLGTPAELKKAVAMPNTGNHVIGSYIKSNDIEGVEREITEFLQKKLRMPLVTTVSN